MKHLAPGILLLVCGTVALFVPTGWTATPTWLFCLGVGLLSLYQGLILTSMSRQSRRSEPEEPDEPMSESVVPVAFDETARVEPMSDEPTARNPSDDELLAGLGVRIDATSPREQ